MKETTLESKVTEIARPVVQDLGFDLVCVRYQGGALQVMAEDPSTHNLGVDDCAKLSRALSAVLDVEDPIEGHYRLEVSSPGIDRPLLRLEDFARFEGYEAKIELDIPLEGQKRFRGSLNGVRDNMIALLTDQGEVALPFESVHKAKLVLTDALLKATSEKRGK